MLDPTSGVPVRDVDGEVLYRRQMVGTKPVSVFEASQVDPPVQRPPEPQMLTGQAPPGLWNALAALVVAQEFRVTRGDCYGANGFTDFAGKEVRVRSDVDDAQAVKTLAHELGHLLLPLPPAASDTMLGASACRGVMEVEAESIAYMVTQAHGLDAAQYTFNYVAGWASRAATKDATIADVITQTGARVIGAVDRILSNTLPVIDAETALVDKVARDIGVDVTPPVTATTQPAWERVASLLDVSTDLARRQPNTGPTTTIAPAQ